MSFHTPGGWMQAFHQALARTRQASSIKVQICSEHADCILVVAEAQRHHIPWRETDPVQAAASLTRHKP